MFNRIATLSTINCRGKAVGKHLIDWHPGGDYWCLALFCKFKTLYRRSRHFIPAISMKSETVYIHYAKINIQYSVMKLLLTE